MNWTDILFTSGITSAAIATLGYLGKEWLTVRLKESVAAEYKKALEDYKSQIEWQEKRKSQAAEIADLFSIWLRPHYFPDEDVKEIRYELQKKYWQLALWLDEPVLKAVHDALASADNPGVTHKEALIAVRKLYVNVNDGIKAEELYHWNAQGESKA